MSDYTPSRREQTNDAIKNKKFSREVMIAINKSNREIGDAINNGAYKRCVDLRTTWEKLTFQKVPPYVIENVRTHFKEKDRLMTVHQPIYDHSNVLCFNW